MTGRRSTLLLMIPLNLVLCVWVAFGRIVFGVFGWFVFLTLPLAAIALVCLTITTVLAWTQDRRPRRLSTSQTVAQWVTWLGMLGLGAFAPDFGDTDDSTRSLLTQLFGYSDNLFNTSFLIAMVFGMVMLVGGVTLLLVLIADRPARRPVPDAA